LRCDYEKIGLDMGVAQRSFAERAPKHLIGGGARQFGDESADPRPLIDDRSLART